MVMIMELKMENGCRKRTGNMKNMNENKEEEEEETMEMEEATGNIMRMRKQKEKLMFYSIPIYLLL
jgi:hypothetical protein